MSSTTESISFFPIFDEVIKNYEFTFSDIPHFCFIYHYLSTTVINIPIMFYRIHMNDFKITNKRLLIQVNQSAFHTIII